MIGYKSRRSHKGKKRSGTKRHQRGGAVPKRIVADLFVAARKLEQKAAHMVKAVNENNPMATEDAVGVSAGIVGLINNHIQPLMKASGVRMGYRYEEGVHSSRK